MFDYRYSVAYLAFCLSVISASVAVSSSAIAAEDNKLASSELSLVSVGRQMQGQQGMSAPLIEQAEDYYLKPDGSRVQLLRKQGVFALKAKRGNDAKMRRDLQTRVSAQSGKLNSKRLGQRLLVKLPNATKSKIKQGFKARSRAKLRADMRALSTSIEDAQAVFANSRGEGDLVLLPKLTVRFADDVPAARIAKVAKRFNLSLDRKLKLSGEVYSFTTTNSGLSASQQLALVRAIAVRKDVRWAEPQFLSQPFKTQFVPNDQFLGDQWHIRDRGFRGSRCDTDCDATDAWGLNNASGLGSVTGAGMVIAVLDDGVQLNHPDLQSNIWINTAEQAGTPGVDDDGNGFVDDINGWDFVVDSSTNPNLQNANLAGSGTCTTGVDSTPGPDNDPSPQATVNCFTINGDPVEQDNHGTAVAGLAAAVGGNNIGVAGTAYRADILPIRVISEFDSSSASGFCTTIAEAMTYAGREADVINNSWGMNDVCMALEDAIDDINTGALMDGGSNVSKRPNLGSPVLFSSGNSASGWVRISVPVSAGEHAYEWRFLRSAFPGDFDTSQEEDSAWLDEITYPDGTQEGFEGNLGSFESGIVLNSCDIECTSFLFPPRPQWQIETSADRVFLGNQSAAIKTAGADCGNSYLSILKDGPGGEISFWVWVNTNLENGSDKFEFLIDGQEVISYGDLPQFIDNQVAYPASLSTTIAVGASNSGDLSGSTSPSEMDERRAFYSQFGSSLDLVAPSSDQHLGIATTDRTGNNDGYNQGQISSDLGNTDYTNRFGGTSASAPMAAGVAAAILATNTGLSAEGVRTVLHDSANKIGRLPYDNGGTGRNDEFGFGRLNMARALQLAAGNSATNAAPGCSPTTFDYSAANDETFNRLTPLAQMFCPARGPQPMVDDFCFPIVAENGNTAVICL